MKSFKEFVTESPQLIPVLDRSLAVELEKKCRAALESKTAKAVENLGDGVDIYHAGSSNGLYFLVEDGRISYGVEYKTVEQNEKILPSRVGIRQVLISRIGETSVFTARIAAKIFWDHLFKKYECLISDSQQSALGKRFWEYQIEPAFERGLTVRIMNTNDQTYEDVTTKKQFSEKIGTTWGSSSWFQRMIIAIF